MGRTSRSAKSRRVRGALVFRRPAPSEALITARSLVRSYESSAACYGYSPLILSGQQGRDTTQSDASVLSLCSLRRHFEVLLAIALSRQIFRRHGEFLRQGDCDTLGSAIGQRQVIVVAAHRIGVTFHEEDFRRIACNRLFDGGGDHGQLLDLIGRDRP